MPIRQNVPQSSVVPQQARCDLLGPATGANTTTLPLHHSLAENGAVIILSAAHLRPSANIAANAAETTFRVVRASDGAVAATGTNVAQVTAAAGLSLTLGTEANRRLAPGDFWRVDAVNVVGGEALGAVRLNFSVALQGVVGG